MQKRKGFTLVELVIVIAVIAILAGVLIGTFASVLNKAQESAKMQEMKAAEHEQKANDILKKLDNAQWFGWEDLEAKIGKSIQDSIESAMNAKADNDKITAGDVEKIKTIVTTSVESTIAKFAAELGQDNTGLTAEQVQYIVEQAVSKKGGVTEAQVKAIVTAAVNNIDTGIKPAQVQKIIDAAVTKVIASELTASDLATALSGVAKQSTVEQILAAVNAASAQQSTLTTDEIAQIFAKYVDTTTGSAKGNYDWYTPSKSEMEIPGENAKEALVALSTLSTAGETFEGKTITIQELLNNTGDANGQGSGTAASITLDGKWNPIKIFKGTLVGNGVTVSNITFDIVYEAKNGQTATGASAYYGWNSSNTYYGDKTGFGFIDVLDGGTVEGLNLVYSMTGYCDDPQSRYTYVGGVVGVMKNGATIDSCTVGGTIYGWNRVGGIVGYVFDGMVADENNLMYVKNCEVTATINAQYSHGPNGGLNYELAGGIVGYVDIRQGLRATALGVAKLTAEQEYSNLVLINNTCSGTRALEHDRLNVGTLVGAGDPSIKGLVVTTGNQLFTGAFKVVSDYSKVVGRTVEASDVVSNIYGWTMDVPSAN